MSHRPLSTAYARIHRKRQAEAGRVQVNSYLPGDLVEQVDRAKEVRGVPNRTLIIEEALRFYFEKQMRA
jgi:metal-responsive CopG/Arc/MetJ family transcriptional regulator